MDQSKKFAIVGCGGRCRMFIDAVINDYSDHSRLVGFCDLSPTRAAYWANYVAEKQSADPLPTYAADQFDQMIKETQADTVIVTTMDSTHHLYIVRAMELGCDVISEKPMTIDIEKAEAIYEAIQRTGRSLRVTFNYRYMSTFSKVKEIVDSGLIGTPTLVDFQWRLDTKHGADYFRRWHREKDCSGGLLVHKSTHHFDLVNWILGDRPATVFAAGGLKFYGEKNAASRGKTYSYDRYTGNVTREEDPFALNLTDGELKELYFDGEKDSGYVRDRNVFGGESKWPITAEDTLAVTAAYRSGPVFSYSLVAYSPWEGERLTVTGTEGQVEYFGRGQGHIIKGQSDGDLAEEQYQGEQYVRLQRMFEPPQAIEIPEAKGGHGGGDTRLLDRVFMPGLESDPLNRDAGFQDGLNSILVGISANRSMETGQAVQLDEVWPHAPLESKEAIKA